MYSENQAKLAWRHKCRNSGNQSSQRFDK